MKSLLLIRHAKSSWENTAQKDFDRPLNDRGKKDAAAMAKVIRKEKEVSLDAIISSPAVRALSTAEYFAEEFKIKRKDIIQVEGLYEAGIQNFYNAVSGFNDDYKSIAIFSHNPGITAFANMLSAVHIDDMPTCSIFALHIQTKKWSDFKDAEKNFWFFDYPKNH